MTVKFYAQPYDIEASGFYFESLAEYRAKAKVNKNGFGGIVEEYEVQIIDGDLIDIALAKAVGVYQNNIGAFYERAAEWDEHQKRLVIIAVGEAGYSFDLATGNPDDLEIDIYELDSLKDLAEQFVDEGLFGDIPERLQFYLDYDAIARDLGMDYSQTEIAGTSLIYRAA